MSYATGRKLIPLRKVNVRMFSDKPGCGAGKGGGGGTIREACGPFGKKEAAREDEYFYKKNREQLVQLKDHLSKEIAYHKAQIQRHKDAIRRHNHVLKEKAKEGEDKKCSS